MVLEEAVACRRSRPRAATAAGARRGRGGRRPCARGRPPTPPGSRRARARGARARRGRRVEQGRRGADLLGVDEHPARGERCVYARVQVALGRVLEMVDRERADDRVPRPGGSARPTRRSRSTRARRASARACSSIAAEPSSRTSSLCGCSRATARASRPVPAPRSSTRRSGTGQLEGCDSRPVESVVRGHEPPSERLVVGCMLVEQRDRIVRHNV